MASVDLNNLGLTFTVRHDKHITLKDFLVGRIFSGFTKKPMLVQALAGINLQVREGQRLGIIGHNGAGKSTLLKVLAGIYQPSEGKRVVQGRISSLFDIALGFEQEANGWENIRFRCYLQGETPAGVLAKQQEIAEFSELGDFLNMPVRYYSAGMRVRLAFSIATAIDPEILLVDEVLSAGDLAFQGKAHQRMREMMAKAQIMIMVSHDLEAARSVCNQVLWLEHGTIRMLGDANQVIDAYQHWASVANQKGESNPGGHVVQAAA